MTKKHITNEQLTTNNKNKENKNIYTCKCGKYYKHMSSLCKHKRTCVIEEKSQNEIISLLIDRQANSDEIIALLISYYKEIKELLLKLYNDSNEQNKLIIELTKNGINNNNTNCNNKTFNLNFFLNNTCKNDMNLSDLILQLQEQQLLHY
jgi:hypothetical protein